MIAKGNLHAHGVKLAAYLTTGFADETAELFELRGFVADNIRDAFIDVQIQAQGTRATKPFFHAYVRAPEGEALSDELWQTFADRLEKRLGFADQPRALAFHCAADGERHLHIAWSRIDLETLTALDPGLYKNKMKELCREFEAEFGLTPVANERGADVKTRAADRAEFEQSRRLNTDLKAIRNTIFACWQAADSGQAFAAALAEQGLMLANGDRRAFVIIDEAGGDHALSKRITGATAAVTRARLADLDPAGLPSVAEAKAMQREAALHSQEPASPAQGPRPMSDEAPELTDEQFSAQRERLIREAAQLAEAERAQAEKHSAQRYREQIEREGEEAGRGEKERQDKDAARAAAGDIADAQSRYAQALGAVYNVRDPYGSLANAAMVEYASFHKQQDALRQDAAAEKDPDKRRLIELRREIEGHDYMTITSDRLAGISRAITMGDNSGARRDDELAKQHTALAQQKRDERMELQRELKQREQDGNAATERGGLGSAAQKGAAALQRGQPPRYRTAGEIALEKAARSEDAAPRERDSQQRGGEAARAERETAKQREGLKPHETAEGAPPSKEARERSAAEKALRSAAGPEVRNPTAPGRDGGGGRGR
jgi:hypothetical protein